MTALIIILVFLLLLTILLLLPINAVIEYSSGGYVLIKYLFFKFEIPLKDWQDKEEITIEKTSKKEKKSNEGFVKNLVKNKGVVEAVSIIIDSLKTLILAVLDFLGNVKVIDFKFSLTVGQGDAAETGIVYGACSAVCYTALAVLNAMFEIDQQKVDISADFEHEILEISLYAVMKITLLKALKASAKGMITLSKAKINSI